MFHSMFYYPVLSGGAPPTYDFRDGDYTVEGYYSFTTTTAGTQQNWKLDTQGHQAAANADFMMIVAESTTAAGNCNVFMDFQGDAGSASLMTVNTSTTNPNNCIWHLTTYTYNPYSDSAASGAFGHLAAPLILPASLAGSNTTRTGRVVSYNTNARIHIIFASWSSNTNSIYRPGNFTIIGSHYTGGNTTVQNWLVDSGLRSQLSSANFTIVQWGLEGTTIRHLVRFDNQGDSGSSTIIAGATGTTNPKNVLWLAIPGVNQYLPTSLMSDSDTTRTGVRQSSVGTGRLIVTVCQWGT